MTKAELRKEIDAVIAEREEIFDELARIENEPEESDDPADWTPQSQIARLNEI